MAIEDIAVPALSAAGGGLTVGWVAKTLITNWLNKLDDMASALQSLIIQTTRIEERVSTLQRTEERTHAQDRILAIVQTKLDELQQDVNGVGRKIRDMATQ